MVNTSVMGVMRRRVAPFVAIFATAATSAFGQTPEASVSLTLDQVVQRALQHSPQVAQAAGAVQTAGTAERTAIGSFLPNLNLSSGASVASTSRFDQGLGTTISGSRDSYSAGLSSSLDIYTGGRRGADLARSRAQTDAAEAAFVEQRYAVVRNAKAGYFDVLRAADLIRSSEARLSRALQVEEAAQRRVDVGSGTRSDGLRARLEVTNARQALLLAQNQKRNAMYALGRLAGADGPVDAAEEQPLQPVALALSRDQLLDLVLQQSPAVISAQASDLAASAAVRAARAQYLPTVSSSGSYNWASTDSPFNDVNGSWSLRLGLSFPIFNRFQREESVERANVQAQVTRMQLEDVRRLARANLARVLGALETTELQIDLAGQALEVAEEDLRMQQERYRLGVSTILDQVTSQENVVRAEADLIAARYDYQLARAELESLIGRDL
ncbi:TolC family outer membrane protein [soil metagenome]